jgi:hypothetical protein
LLIEPYLEARTDGNGKARTYTVLEGLSCSPNGVEVWKTLSDGSISGLTLSGQTSFADGTSAAPSITFGTQPTMGFYKEGQNDITYTTSSATKSFTLSGNQLILGLHSLAALGWGVSNSSVGWDTLLYRDAANTLALRNTTAAQTFRVYNTFTDASNYERFSIGYSANVILLGSEAAGTGTARNISFLRGGTVIMDFANTRLNIYQNVSFNADNTNDIGFAGANRPKNGFFAGTLSFGTFTGNADAPVTGFITITDSGGTTRKLAVIA